MTHEAVPLSAADAALWAAHGGAVRQLPTATPLALLELPLARMQRRLTSPDPETGLLPETAWERFHSVRGPDGRHYAARVAGDPREGLAVQGDWSVLIALMALYDAQGWRTATLVAPPIRAIARLMRAEEGGVTTQRIKTALARFALTRVTLVPMRRGDDPSAVLAGATVVDEAPAGDRHAAPHETATGIVAGPPSAGAVARQMHDAPVGRVHSVLDIEWGEAGIASVTLGRAWCPGEQAEPALWIEAERYFDLVDPLARRLYVLLAAHVARGGRGPWEPSFAWLRSAAGYDPELKRSRVLRELREAADELVRSGVVTDVTLAPARGAPEVVSFTPGAALAVPCMLQGYSLTEPPDDRTVLALLRAFGFAPDEARARLAAKPERVREALAYVCFRRQHAGQGTARAIDHPRAYLERVLDNAQPFAEEAFQRWYRTLVARANAARTVLPLASATSARGAAPGRGGAGEVSTPPRRAPEVIAARSAPDDPHASTLWSTLTDRLRADPAFTAAQPFFAAVLDQYLPLRVADDALELGTASDIDLRLATRPAALEALAAAVAAASDGVVRTVRVGLLRARSTPGDSQGSAEAGGEART